MFETAADGCSPFENLPDTTAVGPADRRPEIRAVSFASATVRSDRVVAATLHCVGGHRRAIAAESLTPGYEVELLPERAREDGRILIAVRIHRRLGTVRRQCVVRFSCGEAAATAAIIVLH